MSFKQKYVKYKTKYLELQNQIGGDIKDDIKQKIEAFAKEKNMSFAEFLIFLMNVNFKKKNDLNYDDKGINNPMIIDNYVVKIIGSRYYSLKARPKLEADTPETLIAMVKLVTDTPEALINEANESNYITVFSFGEDYLESQPTKPLTKPSNNQPTNQPNNLSVDKKDTFIVEVLQNQKGEKVYKCPQCKTVTGTYAPLYPNNFSYFFHLSLCPNKNKIPIEN